MVPGLITISREHYLGLLVIDEMQNLFTRSTKVSAELRDFIVRIINDLKIPVLMVGTAATANILSGTFRVNRRCTGMQEPYWDRFKYNELEWEMFMSELWNYLYVAQDGDSYQTISKEMYELTQGIPDLVVKLFYLAQMAAINSGKEKLTVDLLKEVSAKSLVLNQRHLDDLRSGKTPREEYQYEQVWHQAHAKPPAATEAVAKKDMPKKAASKTDDPTKSAEPMAPPPNAPAINLLGTEPGETIYDTLKRQGNIHNGNVEEPASKP